MSNLILFPASGPIYGVVEADPAWPYRQQGNGAASKHYRTMSVEQICDLPVGEIVLPDSALFLWATPPNIRAAFDVMDAWGFTYKTFAFNWTKFTKHGKLFMGTGSYTRANGEVCLLGVRGKPKVLSHGVRSPILATVREHSRKPDIAPLIEQVFCGPYMRLFARRRRKGWHTWGDQASFFDRDETPEPAIVNGVEQGLRLAVGA